VTAFDDDEDVRFDELLAGRPVPGGDSLAAFLGQLRALADELAPAPTPALVAVLRDGLPVVALDHPAPAAGARSPLLRGLRWAAGLGVAGKILLGAGVAAAAVTGTATIPVVPDSVQAPVRAALTDLGHLIPGSAGGSVPVPSATTPEPVDGVVTPVDPPSAEPVRTGAGDFVRPTEPSQQGEDEKGSARGTRGTDPAPPAVTRSGDQGQQQGQGAPGGAPTSQDGQGSGRSQDGGSGPAPSSPASGQGGSGGNTQGSTGQGGQGAGG
jgi:hypothetical protein